MLRQVFGQAVIGDDPAILRKIMERDINLASCDFPLSADGQRYLDALDLEQSFDGLDFDRASGGYALNVKTLFSTEYHQGGGFSADVSRLPDLPGRESFVRDLARAAALFCQSTVTSDITCQLYINHPKETSLWHRDNKTDKRGFITLAGDRGTFWRPNSTVENWQGEIVNGERVNNYGWFGKDHMDQAQQMGIGKLSIWKGDEHERPLIHAEATGQVAQKPRMNFVMQGKPRDR